MSKAAAIVRLLRPHQWVKNGFVTAPLLFTPSAMEAEIIAVVIWGVVCFCAVSSAIYCLNDIVDAERDRHHQRKRTRPIAAGAVSVGEAAILGVALGAAGLAGAYALAPTFLAVVAGYVALNVAYSLWLKHASIVDVLAIAAGFVLRIYSGSELIGQGPSIWIIESSALLALFLALAKRRDDLVQNLGGEHRQSISGYNLAFVDHAITVVLATMLICYVVYTTDAVVIAKLGTDRLYLTTPFVIAGILRYLQITYVEKTSGSPTLMLLTDWKLMAIVVGWLAVTAGLIYG